MASKTVLLNRQVVHAVGSKTQTVRIHAEPPEAGVEVGYRLPVTADISLDALHAAEFPDVDALREWLVERGGTLLDETGTSRSAVEPLVRVTEEDEAWIARAVPLVEQAIGALLDGFLMNPYLHRVEHSLHAELFSLLKMQGLLGGRAVFDGGRYKTQLVHKEWPETTPQPEKGGGRGLFDLVVLAPTQLARANRRQFRDGRIEAPIVIELGLDYGVDHLEGDARKFRNSGVRHPYLVHLSRANRSGVAAVETFIEQLAPPTQIAYGHLDPSGGAARFRRLGETTLTR